MSRRTAFATAGATLVLAVLVACGVSSEDAPQPIDDSTQEPGTTPSVDTRTGVSVPVPGSVPTPTSSPVPTTSATT